MKRIFWLEEPRLFSTCSSDLMSVWPAAAWWEVSGCSNSRCDITEMCWTCGVASKKGGKCIIYLFFEQIQTALNKTHGECEQVTEGGRERESSSQKIWTAPLNWASLSVVMATETLSRGWGEKSPPSPILSCKLFTPNKGLKSGRQSIDYPLDCFFINEIINLPLEASFSWQRYYLHFYFTILMAGSRMNKQLSVFDR